MPKTSGRHDRGGDGWVSRTSRPRRKVPDHSHAVKPNDAQSGPRHRSKRGVRGVADVDPPLHLFRPSRIGKRSVCGPSLRVLEPPPPPLLGVHLWFHGECDSADPLGGIKFFTNKRASCKVLRKDPGVHTAGGPPRTSAGAPGGRFKMAGTRGGRDRGCAPRRHPARRAGGGGWRGRGRGRGPRRGGPGAAPPESGVAPRTARLS